MTGKHIIFACYAIASVGVLACAIIYPLGFGMKGFTYWAAWIIYPSTIVIIATQRKCLQYFKTITT